MNHDYTISNERRNEFAGIYLLNTMINQSRTFPVFLEGNDEVLEPILEWLLVKEYVTIRNQGLCPCRKGRRRCEVSGEIFRFPHIFDVFAPSIWHPVNLPSRGIRFCHRCGMESVPQPEPLG